MSSDMRNVNAGVRAMIRRLPSHRTMGMVAIVLFGAVGTILLTASRATTPTASQEVEKGTLSSCASAVTDSTASGTHAVKFGDCVSTNGFTHPGIVLDKTQLDFVKNKLRTNGNLTFGSNGTITSGSDPWKSAFNTLINPPGGVVKYSSLSYATGAVPEVKCVGASGNHDLDVACDPIVRDPAAAYTDALVYYYTGNTQYADKAISIMNAWAAAFTPGSGQQYCNDITGINAKEVTDPSGALGYVPPAQTAACVGILFDATYTNGMLQAGWSAQSFVKAAEIIRYSYLNGDGSSKWSASDIGRFSTMLDKVYLPLVNHGWQSGPNWLSTFADATMAIGVFNNDRATFNIGLDQWQKQLASIIYLSGDHNTCSGMNGYPIAPWWPTPCKKYLTPSSMNTLWYNPGQYPDGLEGETCRDLGHTMMGFSGVIYGAETARIQGVDVYNETTEGVANKIRLAKGFELNALIGNYALSLLDPGTIPVQATTVSIANATANTQNPNWNSSLDSLCGGTIKFGGTQIYGGWEMAYNELHNKLGIAMPNTGALIQNYTRASKYDVILFIAWETLTSAGS